MLALVEPWLHRYLADRPHLGCAMLIGACRARGIEVSLVRGQTRVLRDLFLADAAEIRGLLLDLTEDEVRKTRTENVRRAAVEKDEAGFAAWSRALYERVLGDGDARRFLMPFPVRDLLKTKRAFERLLLHYSGVRGAERLSVIDRFVNEIIAVRPRFLGVSMENGLDPLSREIRRRIRNATGIPVILGGALTPFLDLSSLAGLFDEESVDYLVVGPGEEALPALIENLEAGKGAAGIPNVFYREGGAVKGGEPQVIADVDRLPAPDFSDFDLDRYAAPSRILPFQTARGCTWRRCAFCSHHKIYGGKYRRMSARRVVDVLALLRAAYGTSFFALHDEELPPGRVRNLSREILERNVEGLSLYGYARMSAGYEDEPLFESAFRAGFRAMAWGLESGSQRVLDAMRKGTRVDPMGRILEKSSRAGISNTCFFFFGFPGERIEDARATVKFLERHAAHIDGVSFGTFGMSPHAPVALSPGEFGVVPAEDGSFTVRDGMQPDEARRFHDRFATQVGLSAIRVTPERKRFLPPGFTQRTLNFLWSAHREIEPGAARRMLEDGEGGRVHVIVLGELTPGPAPATFHPLDVRETPFMNEMRPVKARALDRVEEQVVRLASGRLSAAAILDAVARDPGTASPDTARDTATPDAARKTAESFMCEALDRGWAIAFQDPW